VLMHFIHFREPKRRKTKCSAGLNKSFWDFRRLTLLMDCTFLKALQGSRRLLIRLSQWPHLWVRALKSLTTYFMISVQHALGMYCCDFQIILFLWLRIGSANSSTRKASLLPVTQLS